MLYPSKIRQIVLLVLALIMIIGVVSFFYSYPKEINITYPAIQYKPGEPSSSAVKTTIKIEGTLTDPLFRSKKFSGNIEIGTFEFTKTYKLMDIDFSKEYPFGDGGFPVFYETIQNGAMHFEMFGRLKRNSNFEHLVIEILNTTHLYQRIVAPAENYEAAMIIEKLVESSDK